MKCKCFVFLVVMMKRLLKLVVLIWALEFLPCNRVTCALLLNALKCGEKLWSRYCLSRIAVKLKVLCPLL